MIHKDRKIYEWMPEGYETWTRAQVESTPRIMFNVHSDHAFSYDRSAGQAIAKMKVVEPKRIRPYRLAMHPSDTRQFRRASFEEMREFTPEGLQAAIEAREAVTFHAQDMDCLLYTSPSPRDLSTSRMPSSA